MLNLADCIGDSKWIVGAVNLDEDIHFSSYYLRMSLDKNIGHLFQGYSKIISFYRNFNEEYFLLEEECSSLSKKLIEKIINQPSWFINILDMITKKSNILKDVFDYESISGKSISKMSLSEIGNLYKKQFDASIDLYQYARIPEMLDKGTTNFTNYLLSNLKDLLGKQNVTEEFLTLTAPTSYSIFQEASNELISIREMIVSNNTKHTLRSLRLTMNAETKKSLQQYLEKWRFLYYHGYGERRLASIESTLLYMINQNPKVKYDDLFINKQSKDNVIVEIGLSNELRLLFDLYPKLAISKLYRKYYQIRNFYFLDMLLDEISTRIDEPLAFVRSMLPEEIIAICQGNQINREDIGNRFPVCMYYADENIETIITDNIIINQASTALVGQGNKPVGEFIGFSVSKGVARGNCIIINRKTDAKFFCDGDVILSDSADPDIFEYVERASALLTVQGGATSHAALFCRERSIPAIVGIKNLFEIKQGDYVFVDTNEGKVIILGNSLLSPIDLGNKARNLHFLRNSGFVVPKFLAIDYFQAKELVSHGNGLDDFVSKIQDVIGLKNGDTFILRSSAINEDNEDESHVGKFYSIPNVEKDKLVSGIKKFVEANEPLQYRGSIIIQRMIPFDWCGVSVTGDNRLNGINFITIEICQGRINRVTEGREISVRVTFDKIKDEIYSIENENKIDISALNINSMITTFRQIETLFGCVVDIEWGVYNNILYISQARPIVSNKNRKKHSK